MEKTAGFQTKFLCAQVAAGDRAAEETLVLRYARLVRVCARPLFLAGGDSEDLIQEGMLGLLSAIRNYRPGQGAAFRTFAEVCVRRRLVSAVRAAAGGKHTPVERIPFLSIHPSFWHIKILPFLARQTTSTRTRGRRQSMRRISPRWRRRSVRGSPPWRPRSSPVIWMACPMGRSRRKCSALPRRWTTPLQRIRRKVARYLSQGEPSES